MTRNNGTGLSHFEDRRLRATDGVYDGSDEEERDQLEMILREHDTKGARDICNALLDYAVEQDEHLQQIGDGSLIDDKTVFIIKRLETSSS